MKKGVPFMKHRVHNLWFCLC